MDALKEVAYEKGNFKKAYDLFKQEDALEDSLFNLESVAQMSAIRSQYEIEKKEAENQLLKEQARLNKEIINTQRMINWILGIGTLLLIISCTGLIILNQIRKRKNAEIRRDRDIISQQAAELKDLHVYKSEFFANVSHDLASPITLIKGYVDLLNKGKKNFDHEVQEYIHYISDSVERLRNLTEEIRQLIKLETNRYALIYSELEIDPFFSSLKGMYSARSSSSGIKLNYDSSIVKGTTMNMDKAVLEKIVFNLIDNAYKYNTTGNKIEVRTSLDKEDLHIKVIDDGPGILESRQEDVFKRFYQIRNNGSNKIEGQGIGLSLVKELVELLGGQIYIDSEPTKETCFHVILPTKRKISVA
jgi:signal transduction histidine kinase